MSNLWKSVLIPNTLSAVFNLKAGRTTFLQLDPFGPVLILEPYFSEGLPGKRNSWYLWFKLRVYFSLLWLVRQTFLYALQSYLFKINPLWKRESMDSPLTRFHQRFPLDGGYWVLFLINLLWDLLIFQHFMSMKWCDKSLKNRSWCLALSFSSVRWRQKSKPHFWVSPSAFL